MLFINFSNHCSDNWGADQIEAASRWGRIIDIPFPDVPADADEEDIQRIAYQCVNEISNLNPEAVLCQGEFTLAFAVVEMLKRRGITVVAACSNRKVVESFLEDGTCQKESFFEFIRFRKYGV